jgi:hypothetical protein
MGHVREMVMGYRTFKWLFNPQHRISVDKVLCEDTGQQPTYVGSQRKYSEVKFYEYLHYHRHQSHGLDMVFRAD